MGLNQRSSGVCGAETHLCSERIAVCLGRGSMERKSDQMYKSCGALEARGAGRGEVWYGMVWLRNLRSKLFKSFCSTYLVKRVIQLTSEI